MMKRCGKSTYITVNQALRSRGSWCDKTLLSINKHFVSMNVDVILIINEGFKNKTYFKLRKYIEISTSLCSKFQITKDYSHHQILY